VFRALADAVIAAILTALRGLLALRLVMLHPLESARLIGTAPWLVARARALLLRMHFGDAVVFTPRMKPLLRTALTGLGDVTTKIATTPEVTPALVAEHLENVRSELGPLQQLADAMLRAHALTMAAAAAWAMWHTAASESPTLPIVWRVLAPLLSGFAASLAWSLAFRGATEFVLRMVFGRLQAE
jgi:hypothetical protein